jgi:hypothetical protein
LRFEDPQVETLYKQQLENQIHRTLKVASPILLLFLVTLHLFEFFVLYNWRGFTSVPWLLGVLRLSLLVVVVTLSLTPRRRIEIVVCATETYILCTIAAYNSFRMQRLSLIDKNTDSEYVRAWENCDKDLVIHARDTLLMVFILFAQAFFRNSMPVRVVVSWIPPACVSCFFSCFLIVPSMRLQDGGGTVLLLMLLIGVSSTIWVAGYLNEKKDREVYALTCQSEAKASWQQDLLELVFPIVVKVVDGNIAPLAQVQEHFGGQVSQLDDLPSRRDDGGYDTEIAALVTEVEATRKAAKRNALIEPRGADKVFDCSVYACLELDGDGTVLGIEIRDYWPAVPHDLENSTATESIPSTISDPMLFTLGYRPSVETLQEEDVDLELGEGTSDSGSLVGRGLQEAADSVKSYSMRSLRL